MPSTVYLPLWSFSTHAISDYAGRRGERRMRLTGGHLRSYTAWRKVNGRVTRYFDSVMVGGCSPLPEKLPRWPMDRLAPYARGSAQGRRIVAYDVEPEHGFERAKFVMSEQIRRDVRTDIGGSDQNIKTLTTMYPDPSYSLLLLPAWLLTYIHNGRTWSVLINGVTGEVAGRRPYSAVKIGLLVAALITALTTAIVLHHVLGAAN